jgi:3-carboxy-cis,cis-muconate cycloisomerase
MLVARRALRPVMIDAAGSATALAGLARRHRDTPIVGRTLGQHAAVTSYGAICAARLVALDDAGSALATVVRDRLAVQLGGPVGTLAAAGDSGPRLVEEVAAELGLAEPVLAWHTTRGRIGELAAALGILAGELAGVALDVVLLSSGDVGELSVANPGGSSSMPHKRNPSAAVLALAAAHRVPALVATLLAGMPQELQRATGHWQAEAGLLTDLIRAVGAVARQTRRTLTGLRVHTDVMAKAVQGFAVRTGGSPDPGPAGLWVDRALAAHQAVDRP